MDLSVKQGIIVGVIKEGDPMGNKDRWFVNDGGECFRISISTSLSTLDTHDLFFSYIFMRYPCKYFYTLLH